MKRLILILCVLLPLTVRGANEIRAFVPGATACFSVVREIDGDVWHIVDKQFEPWGTDANDADDYDMALTDKSGDMFVGSLHADFVTDAAAGYYHILTYQQAGANAADTDPAIWHEWGYWDGSTWTPGPDAQDIDTIAGDVAGLDGEAMRGTDSAITSLAAITDDKDSYKATGFNTTVPDAAGTAAALHAITDGKIDAAQADIDTIAIDVAGIDGAAMRGTDSANTTVPDAAGTAAALHAATDALISALNNLSAAQAQAASAAALTAYDPATRTEATADKDEVLAGLGDIEVDNAAIADAVLDELVEGAVSLRQSMRLFLSVFTGKTTGGGTTRIRYRDIGDTKNRLDVNVDSRGNRTKINTRDGS